MFPNSPSISLALVSIVGKSDELGNKTLIIKDSKEVVGINKSITSSEYQTSVMMNKTFDLKVSLQAFVYNGQKYAITNNQVYKIERTFINGQFVELYLSLSELELEDLSYDKSW